MPGISVQPLRVCRLRACPFLGEGATGGSMSMALVPEYESVLSVWLEQLEPELESPVTSLKVLRALGVRWGAEKPRADADLGGMPWRSWVSRTIRGEPSSSPPLSLIGDGSRRF